MQITIIVRDTPRPGGNKIAGFNSKTGKSFVREKGTHTATWRSSVQAAALQAYNGQPIRGACQCHYEFFFKRPIHHFGTGKESWYKLKANAPIYHTKKPDLTKLIRSTEDALTGIVWHDDSQVCIRSDGKYYVDEVNREGCIITINTLEEPETIS